MMLSLQSTTYCKHLTPGPTQANVISPYPGFPRIFSVFLKPKKLRLPKYLLPETHLTQAVPAVTKEIPILTQMVQTFIAVLPLAQQLRSDT